MTTHAKAFLATLIVLLALSIPVGVASSLRSLSIVGETTITASTVGTFMFGTTIITCPMTIIRTVSRLIPKASGILLGKIIGWRTDPPGPTCSINLGTLQGVDILGLEPEEACRLFYEGISGTLPSVTGINTTIKHCLIGFRTRILIIGTITCLYAEAGEGISATESVREGRLSSIIIGSNRLVLLEGQSASCPREGRFSGAFTVARSPVISLV